MEKLECTQCNDEEAKTTTTKSVEITPMTDFEICNLIYTIRNTPVMLDKDLAMLYGVQTKVLNQAVSRNLKRFPDRFCLRLEKDEADDLRSQIVALHPELDKQDIWWRHMPRVFFEQEVSMLSAILHSETAIVFHCSKMKP